MHKARAIFRARAGIFGRESQLSRWTASVSLVALVLGYAYAVRADSAAAAAAYWQGVWSKRMAALRSVGPPLIEHDGKIVEWTFDWKYKDRAELDAGCREYLSGLMRHRFLLEYPDVEDYLSRLLREVHPGELPKGHPGALNVRIMISPTPNAFAMGDGTLLVTSGLLICVRGEDELRAVLAHEVGHIYGDHELQARSASNTRAAVAGVLTTLAGVAAGAAAAQSSDPSVRENAGAIGLATALAAAGVADFTIEALGFSYSRKQEKEADAMAQGWLLSAARDSLALGRALSHLSTWSVRHGGREKSGLMDSHPGYSERLAAIGLGDAKLDPPPSDGGQATYDGHIAKILSDEAGLAIAFGRYGDALEYTSRALDSGWADADTYIRRAIAMRLRYSQTDSLRVAATLLDQAERGGGDPRRILVERTLLHLRRGDEGAALTAIDALLALSEKAEPHAEDQELHNWATATRSQLRLRQH